MPAQKDIAVWKGNSFSIGLNFKTQVGTVKVPLDLTGSTLVFRTDGGVIRKETGEAGFTLDDAAAGEATLSLTADETRSLPQGPVKYEVERRIGATQTSLLFGTMNVSEWVNDD